MGAIIQRGCCFPSVGVRTNLMNETLDEAPTFSKKTKKNKTGMFSSLTLLILIRCSHTGEGEGGWRGGVCLIPAHPKAIMKLSLREKMTVARVCVCVAGSQPVYLRGNERVVNVRSNAVASCCGA